MLDIRFLRENPEVVKQNIRNKFQDSKLPLVDEVMELDKRNRESREKQDFQNDWRSDEGRQERRGRRG